jgi:hypothetical protein
VAGHSYAVQLRDGRVGQLTIQNIRNPQQVAAKGRQVFRGGPAARTVRKIGGGTAPTETGDTAPGTARDAPAVYFDVWFSPPQASGTTAGF